MSHAHDTPDRWTGRAKLPNELVDEIKVWLEELHPDPRMRPPLREVVTELVRLGLAQAKESIKPEPTPLDRLRGLNGTQS